MTATMTHREHGTYVRYVVEQCRCDDCRAANRDYERARKQRVEPPYVGAERAREHLAYLAENGIGLKSVARITGLSHGGLSKVVYGDRARRTAPSKRVRRETEQKILAVTVHDGPDGTREPAGPTWKVIKQLLGRGWTKVAIAHAIGQGGPGLQIGRQVVTRANARAIADLLEQPVPPRWDRHGNLIEVDMDELARDQARRDAEAERRREYRQRDAAEFWDEPVADPYELPLLGAAGDPVWRAQGACRRPDVPNYLFFPVEGDVETLNAARALCDRCPVVSECLTYALELGIEDGVWGGKSERERLALRSVAA